MTKGTPAKYNEYPAFQARLAALEKARYAAYVQRCDQTDAKIEELLQSDACGTAGIYEQTTKLLEELHRFTDDNWAAYHQQVVELHQEMQVPFLSDWQSALAKTGHAVFHEERQSYPGRKLAAEIIKEGDVITCIYTETITFPNATYRTCDDFDSHLAFSDIVTETWEAVPAAEQTSDKENI